VTVVLCDEDNDNGQRPMRRTGGGNSDGNDKVDADDHSTATKTKAGIAPRPTTVTV
jgi:hypothetical protein